MVDEGYRACPYKDSLGIYTVGFGHVQLPTDKLTGCLTPQESINLLRFDYNKAKNSVEDRYPWAEGEVRLVLINLTFQMGSTGLSKFKNMLSAMEAGDFDLAASEMIDSRWFEQTPSRVIKLSGRIMNLGDTNNENR